MKQIIDGLRYDTDAATPIVEDHWNGRGGGDFRACTESLYRTESGAYFLAGRGGPMTRYAKDVPNGGRSGGSGIVPLTDGEAMQWLEEHGLTDRLEEHFGDRITDA